MIQRKTRPRYRLGAFQVRRRPLRLGDTCIIDRVTGGRVCTAPTAGGSTGTGTSTGTSTGSSGNCGTRIVCSGGSGGKNPGFCQRMVIPCFDRDLGPIVSVPLPGGITTPQIVPVQLQFQTPSTVSVPTSYIAPTPSASGVASGIDLTSGISNWLAGTTLGLSNKYVALGGGLLALLYFQKRR